MNIGSEKPISTRKIFIASGFAFMFCAMDVGIISFIVTMLIKEWNLTSLEAGWIGSVNSFGMLVGAIVAGVLADRFGRNKILILTVLLFTVASGLSAFTSSLAMFLVLRFFIGVGLGGEAPLAATYISEHYPAHKSGRMVVLLEAFWPLGWILSCIIGYFIVPEWGWRLALIIGALPGFFVLYMRRGLPDPPEFKKLNKQQSSVWSNLKTIFSPKYARDTTMLWILFLLIMFTYYGLFLWLPSFMVMKGFSVVESFGYVLLVTLVQLPGFFSAAYLVEKAGRKYTLIGFMLFSALSALFFGMAESVPQLIAAGVAISFFIPGVMGTIYAYVTDHYDSKVRGIGVGMTEAAGRIGSIFGPIAIGAMITANLSFTIIFSVFFAAFILASLNVWILGRETRVAPSVETMEVVSPKNA
ncbi:MFS transporter [Neobacillus mesonae]|uniref:MFS transporter n=1 Tax=Neobacillus mesonae TaxID=1193713 RepID=UPI0008324D50|nr:MFS transporter [Neobacillus mesonae]